MAATTTLMQGVLYVNYRNYGWSEKYALADDNYTAAIARMLLICQWRAAILAQGCVIEWARVSIAGNPKEARAAITQPMPSLWVTAQGVDVGPVNDPETALHFRLETADGRHADRLIRGINDQWVKDTLLDATMAPLTPVAPGALPPTTDLTQLGTIRHFMSILLVNTVHARKTGVGAGYTTTDWDKIIYRGIANRKTGRPFGMSRGRAPMRA